MLSGVEVSHPINKSKQLIVYWLAAVIISLCTKRDLIRKSFIVTGINTSLNGADDHMIRSDSDIDIYSIMKMML